MASDLFNPLRLDGGNTTTEKAGGFNQLGRNNPATGLFTEFGPGVAVKAYAARAEVPVFLFVFLPHVAEQAAQHGQVQLLVAGRFGVHLPTLLANRAQQL